MAQVYSTEFEPSTTNFHDSPFDIELPKSQQKVFYRVELREGQDGWIVAKCPDVKGAVSQGRNRDEALRNIVEAISLVLEEKLGKKAEEFIITWDEI